ncbi:unnamed protein product [Ostreobium quekettii]|uniref:Cytochrome P450 n=1 Tax=Ostreobium quekettii TaxID=121088 RepID=A0A8S1IUX3_9CHLO|nr:unnamed protein product [Ostreobium quekettii]
MDLRILKQLAALAFLAVLVFRILQKWWFRIKYDWHLVPGPQGYPLLGNLPQTVSWDKPRMHLKITEWAKEYGKVIKLDLPGIGRIMYLMDPEYIQNHITGYGAHGLPKDPVYNGFRLMFGPHGRDNIITTTEMDDRWKVTRKGTAKAFSTEALKAVFPQVLKKVDEVAEIIKSSAAKEPVDIQHLLKRFSVDTIGLTAYKIDFKALQDEQCPVFEALMYCSSEMLASIANPLRGIVKRFFPMSKFAQECNRMYSQLHSQYDWVLKELRGRGEPAADDLSIGACLMRLKDPKSGAPLDDTSLGSEVAAFIQAGSDSTSHTTMWILFVIAALPEVQQKIVAEMKDKSMFECLSDGSIGRFTYSDIASLSYLTMVTKEAMRMFPITPLGTARITTRDGERVCGYRLPKGTMIGVPFHPLYHVPWLFEEPERFRPERWSSQAPQEKLNGDASCEKRGGAPRSFWSFSDGPRDCIGQRMALMVLHTVVAVLVAKFEIRLADRMGGWEGTTARQYIGMSLSIDGGMWVHFKPRGDAH